MLGKAWTLLNDIVILHAHLALQLAWELTVVLLEPVPAHCHVAENEAELSEAVSLRVTFRKHEG
jgi:hypothetical protein